MTEGSPQVEQPGPRTGRRLPGVADLTVALGLLLLLLLVPLAQLVSATQPLPPQVEPRPSAVRVATDQANRPVRDLPVGVPGQFKPERPDDLRAVAERALGARGGGALLSLLGGEQKLQETVVAGIGSTLYPYRYPAITRLLDQAPGRGHTAEAGALGAALLLVAGRYAEDSATPYPGGATTSAAAAAFAVLDRARTTGDCGVQLNLLLLVSADAAPRDGPVRDEARRAESACPNDPTPGWLLGQYQSQRARVGARGAPGSDPVPPGAQQEAVATFEQLVRQFPSSAAVVAGAADAHLRRGLRLAGAQPFTARNELYRAVAGYLGARDIDPGVAVPGLARAYIALGEPARAAELLRPLIAAEPTSGPLLELLVTAEESAQEFTRAESTARQLADRGRSAYAASQQLFAVPGSFGERLELDPSGPQSLGTETHLPFTVHLRMTMGTGGGASVNDVSFIPTFRADPDVMGSDPACAELAWRRNAILAGRAAAALAGIPAPLAVRSARPGADCSLGAGPIRDIARAEHGLPVDPEFRDDIADDRQNLFRWAGDLPHAETVVETWAKQSGGQAPLPAFRLAEVYFLQRRYDDAAAAFGVAARRIRAAEFDNDVWVYEALLGRGAALLSAGRSAEGLPLLRSVADLAARGMAYQTSLKDATYDPAQVVQDFAAVAYHAWAHLADAERESGVLRAAVEDYRAARELVPLLTADGATGLRPERLDGNQALAELALGSVAAARQAIDRAVRADPMNPAFLMTAGFVADRAGQCDTAARFNAAALASDPGAFPAANDLGVEMARLHRHDEAVTALRRALGVRPDYALAWFNLGIVYSRMGPAHLLSSQGALARAFGLDESLRDRKRQLTIDAQVYRTGLDLSKPLPPRWSVARLQQFAPAPTAGLLAALVLGLALARTAASGAQGTPMRAWVESVADRLERLPLVNRVRRPAWALTATALVFLLFAVVRAPVSVTEVGVLAGGALVLGAAAMRARTTLARRVGATIQQESWGPGIAFGVASAVVAPWAPLPVVRGNPGAGPGPGDPGAGPGGGNPGAGRVHAAAPVALGLIAVVLFVESAVFAVPVARSLANAAVIMVASTLIPVPPLDGAQLTGAGLLAGAGAVGATVLLGLAVV